MRKTTFFLFVALLFASCIEDTEITPNTKDGNFEALWKIIDTRYCYLDYKQINWDSIHTAYKSRLASINEKDESGQFELFGQMLGELKDGHVNLYSDFNVSRYWKWFTDYPSNFNSSLIYNSRYLGDDYRISGGMRYQKIDNGNIGYIYYGDFSGTFTDVNMEYAFNYFEYCKGIIIDVRDNGGGYLDLAEKLASYFFTKKTITGYMKHKTGDGHSEFSNAETIYTPANTSVSWQKPVVILTNRMSFSATNSFVCRMKLAPKATVIGDKTGGGGGLPFSSEIPNGWMVRFSAAPMFDANMDHTEWGLDPDIKVDMDSTDVSKGYDTIIERAIKWLQ